MTRIVILIVVVLVAPRVPVDAQESVKVDSQTVDATQEKRQATEEAIRKQFPDLDKDVLAGWVDAYADLSVSELQQLLLQKSLLPSSGAADMFLSEYTAELDSDANRSQQAYFLAARTILRNNILHAETLGYRRRKIHTMVTEPSTAGDGSEIVLTSPDFDFTPAQRSVSQNPLHVALADKQGFGTMFRLEPGCILTRCGRFERLEDGRLGLKVGHHSLALYGDIKIPADVSDAYIDTTGLVTSLSRPANAEKPIRTEYGRIQVAAINNMSILHSNNGVFFSLPAEEVERSVTMTSRVSLVYRSLEKSNVDVEAEMNSLRRIEFLSR